MSQPLSYEERLALGQKQRKLMKRAGHAAWDAKMRKHDPFDLLEQSVRGRLPDLVRIKWQRMAAAPFAFFRGAAPVMAYDLSLTPNSGILNQICGDAHVSNLGAYDGPDGRLVFDINDFDESIPAPFEWDLKRMASSILLAGRGAKAKAADSEKAVGTLVGSYRSTVTALSRMAFLDVARHQVRRLSDISAIKEIMQAAMRATPCHNLQALTEKSGRERVFKSNPPVLTRVTGAEAAAVVASLAAYVESLLPERRHLMARYRVVDVGFKVVGTGSVGLRDYVVYLEGNGPNDPLLLQVKEETASCYAPYLGHGDAQPNATGTHQGRRVAEAERAMQLQSDPFLGWTSIAGRDFLVRQLNDHKAAVDIATLKASTLPEYAQVCGELLARGHARAGDPAVIAGYLGNSDRFDKAILRYADAYADQTEHDWKKLLPKMKAAAEQPHTAASKGKSVAAKAPHLAGENPKSKGHATVH